MIVRVLMSWFPIRPGTAAGSIYVLVRDLTEPVLAPLRRVIPPIGMIDVSPIVAFVGLVILQRVLCAG
jgi:YggT family protein